MRYGSIPAGGLGTRLQPIGFSKELAPVRRRAVIEYLIERLILSGIDKIFINTAEDKTDLIRYLADKSIYKNNLIFLVRSRKGLLDGVVLPEQFLRDDDVLYFGLPDTVWYPQNGFSQLDQYDKDLVLGLFDTGTPEKFDSVVIDKNGIIESIDVKVNNPKSKWTWAMGKMSVKAARKLRDYEYELGPKPLFGEALHLYAKDNPSYAIQLSDSHCLDIGVPEEYDRADSFVKQYEK